MATYVDYDHRIRLLPKITQESHRLNDQPLHQSAATFLVQFRLYTVRLHTSFSEGLMFSPVGGALQSKKSTVIRIPVTGSPADHSREFLSILRDMEIPRNSQSEILEEIASRSRGMDPITMDIQYMEVKIMKTNYVEILSHRREEDEDDIARAERESMEVEPRPIPATKSFIDALQRVDFDGPESSSLCTICMEEIRMKTKVIKMPCSHVYHADCVVQWLQISHLCPLCRHHMPCT